MTRTGRRERGRVFLPLMAALGIAAGLAWLWLADSPPQPVAALTGLSASPASTLEQAPAAGAVPSAAASAPLPGPPLSEAERQARRAMWQSRLERARDALSGYQLAARYPHESRPASEHPDQMRPFDPVAEEHPLRMPGSSPIQGVRLKTTQERTFLSGNEASRVTLGLVDANGQPLAMRVQRAVLKEVPQPGATTRSAEYPMPVNDNGQLGDVQALDGIFTAWVQPQVQGFAAVAGLLRLELNLEYGGQPGFLYFDFIYSPETAARWLPGARDELRDGSLAFVLRAEILLPGRYVVSARVDDAGGRTIALALFNGELPRGTQDIRLPVFGKLIRDENARFPLSLRDVDAFLLKPDSYPDRVMLPRLAGVVHTTRMHAAGDFSDAEWQSEERQRYLEELGRDVKQAETELERLGP
jgi:hypothetical protein